jgi:hypothetical protein
MGKENCTKELMKLKVAYPRTCKECGLGPCKYDKVKKKK